MRIDFNIPHNYFNIIHAKFNKVRTCFHVASSRLQLTSSRFHNVAKLISERITTCSKSGIIDFRIPPANFNMHLTNFSEHQNRFPKASLKLRGKTTIEKYNFGAILSILKLLIIVILFKFRIGEG